MNVAGIEISKDTVVRLSIGTILVLVVTVWTALDIGRPLFASDLKRIEEKIDAYQTASAAQLNSYQSSTAVQILIVRREALRSDLRVAKRYARADPSDAAAQEDVDEIEEDILVIDAKIVCHRTNGCTVEFEL